MGQGFIEQGKRQFVILLLMTSFKTSNKSWLFTFILVLYIYISPFFILTFSFVQVMQLYLLAAHPTHGESFI